MCYNELQPQVQPEFPEIWQNNFSVTTNLRNVPGVKQDLQRFLQDFRSGRGAVATHGLYAFRVEYRFFLLFRLVGVTDVTLLCLKHARQVDLRTKNRAQQICRLFVENIAAKCELVFPVYTGSFTAKNHHVSQYRHFEIDPFLIHHQMYTTPRPNLVSKLFIRISEVVFEVFEITTICNRVEIYNIASTCTCVLPLLPTPTHLFSVSNRSSFQYIPKIHCGDCSDTC